MQISGLLPLNQNSQKQGLIIMPKGRTVVYRIINNGIYVHFSISTKTRMVLESFIYSFICFVHWLTSLNSPKHSFKYSFTLSLILLLLRHHSILDIKLHFYKPIHLDLFYSKIDQVWVLFKVPLIPICRTVSKPDYVLIYASI